MYSWVELKANYLTKTIPLTTFFKPSDGAQGWAWAQTRTWAQAGAGAQGKARAKVGSVAKAGTWSLKSLNHKNFCNNFNNNILFFFVFFQLVTGPWKICQARGVSVRSERAGWCPADTSYANTTHTGTQQKQNILFNNNYHWSEYNDKQMVTAYIWVFSHYLTAWVFTAGFFLPRLKLKFLHCHLYKRLVWCSH